MIKQNTNVLQVEIVTMIKVKSRVGEGIESDPVRIVTEYYKMPWRSETGISSLLYREDTFQDIEHHPTPDA